MAYKRLQLKTKQEKAVAKKIIDELVVLPRFMEVLPKAGTELSRKWTEGVVFGVKYVISQMAGMLNDKRMEALYKELIDWDKEEEQLFGKQYRRLKELRARKGTGATRIT